MGRAFEFRKGRKMKRWDKMSKDFTRIGKEIVMAVKENGPNPDTNARLREAFVNVPSDLPALAATYPLLLVDMQASVFPGELTDMYSRATPQLVVQNGNDAWYLADLLEHYGIPWSGWTDLLTMWQINRQAASELRLYDLGELVRSAE